MKVIFMGSDNFSLQILEKLVHFHQVNAVFTALPKPHGRGMKVIKNPIQLFAENNCIPFYMPSKLRDRNVQNLIDNIEADAIIVASYGLIIPEELLRSKKYGCINVHPSLLPRFRGASPLQHTILFGDNAGGVCIMKMDAGIDTGPILKRHKFPLSSGITFKELEHFCARIGVELLIEVLDNIDDLPPIEQNTLPESPCYAPKLTKADAIIDWSKSAIEIDCQIRALNPWPGAFFIYQGEQIKIIEAGYEVKEHKYSPGVLLDEEFSIACGSGILKPYILQKPGRKPLSVKELLRGFKIKLGTQLQLGYNHQQQINLSSSL